MAPASKHQTNAVKGNAVKFAAISSLLKKVTAVGALGKSKCLATASLNSCTREKNNDEIESFVMYTSVMVVVDWI